MMIDIHPENPQGRKIDQVVDILKNGGIIIYPTDSVYALGCDFANQDAVDRICKLRGLDPVKANLTFICESISQVSDYTAQLSNDTFRLLKRNLPGPYTFILRSNHSVPKLFRNKKRTVGVRIPNHQIVQDIVSSLGRPILSTSLKRDESIVAYYTDPGYIHEQYENQVDAIVNGGVGSHEPTTVVDCTGDEFLILREGREDLRL